MAAALAQLRANRISGTASRRGTQTHKQIQHYLGKDTPCSDTSPLLGEHRTRLARHDAVRLIESPVFHYDLSYAGRDCVASYKDIPVCEWKTADKPKGMVERLYEYPLQLAAYLGAVNKYYQDYGVKIDHALLVVAIPEMPAEVFWFEPAAITDYWQQWNSLSC